MPIPLEQRSQPHPSGYREITPVELARSGYTGRLIDVREPAEYQGELGHLLGAELVPLGTVAGKAAGWEREEELVVICRSGNRSGQAAQQLVRLGFKRVYNLVGGMLAHNAAGLPITRS